MSDTAAAEFVLAMHDFEPVAPNATCLSFKAGQVIRVLNRDPTGWWDGELDGRRGWFPSNYVNANTGPGASLPGRETRHRVSRISLTFSTEPISLRREQTLTYDPYNSHSLGRPSLEKQLASAIPHRLTLYRRWT